MRVATNIIAMIPAELFFFSKKFPNKTFIKLLPKILCYVVIHKLLNDNDIGIPTFFLDFCHFHLIYCYSSLSNNNL